jgi:ribonuclease P protein component
MVALIMVAIARLKLRREFLEVAGAGRKWVTPGLILQAKARPGEGPEQAGIRVGFTASKKVGIAVERNRARRRLRAVVAEVMPRHAASDHDYVLIARQGTSQRPYRALVEDLQMAMRRLGVFRSNAP